jgi:hypothetical protein
MCCATSRMAYRIGLGLQPASSEVCPTRWGLNISRRPRSRLKASFYRTNLIQSVSSKSQMQKARAWSRLSKLVVYGRQEMRMRVLACRAVAGRRKRGRPRAMATTLRIAHVPYHESATSYAHDTVATKPHYPKPLYPASEHINDVLGCLELDNHLRKSHAMPSRSHRSPFWPHLRNQLFKAHSIWQ